MAIGGDTTPEDGCVTIGDHNMAIGDGFREDEIASECVNSILKDDFEDGAVTNEDVGMTATDGSEEIGMADKDGYMSHGNGSKDGVTESGNNYMIVKKNVFEDGGTESRYM